MEGLGGEGRVGCEGGRELFVGCLTFNVPAAC